MWHLTQPPNHKAHIISFLSYALGTNAFLKVMSANNATNDTQLYNLHAAFNNFAQ